MMDSLLQNIYGLNRDRSSGHEKPHKPVLLLAALELIDKGLASPGRIPFGDDLREAFGRFFDVVRQGNDKPTIENPFYYLQSDGLWSVRTAQGSLMAPLGVKQLLEVQAVGSFDERYQPVLESEFNRECIRESVLSRFFPKQRDALRAVMQYRVVPKVAEEPAEYRVQRDSAFRKVVVDIYDYQCVACGMRIRLPPDGLTFVDAAHLIPFSESHNDHPSNGIALCKNHHWAMDRNLIAPGDDGRWHVSPLLKQQRSTGEAALLGLDGQELLPPHDAKFFPAADSLRWRLERLAK